MKNLWAALCVLLIVISCQKDHEIQPQKEKEDDPIKPTITLYSGATAATWGEVDEQMEWIAKGLVFSARDGDLRHEVYEKCVATSSTTPDGYEFMQPIEDQVENNVGYSLQLSHEDSIDDRFSAHTYDRTFFPGFEIDNKGFLNFIYIPDANDVDTTQQLVLVPQRKWETWFHTDTVTGYYYDAVADDIDSVLLIGEEPPTDQYYIWVVNYITDIPSFNKTIKRDLEPGCGNGYCEPSIGEDASNCIDCMPLDPNTGMPKDVDSLYNIEVEEVEVYKDVSPYFESWLSGSYDFWAAGCMYQNDTIISSAGEGYIVNPSIPEHEFTDQIFFGKISRNQICRENSNGVTKNCPAQAEYFGEELFENVTAEDTLMCIFHEGIGRTSGLTGAFNSSEIHIGYSPLYNPDYPGEQNIYFLTTHRNNKSVNPYHSQAQEEDINPKPGWFQGGTNWEKAVEYSTSNLITINSFDPVTKLYTFDNGEYRVVLRLRKL